jgi:TonB family protein
MVSPLLSQPSHGEHFWKRAVLATALVYAGVLGLGFWQGTDAFVIHTSSLEGGPSANAESQASRIEVDLEAATTAPPVPVQPPPFIPASPEPTPPPDPAPVPAPQPVPVPAPPLPAEIPDFPVPEKTVQRPTPVEPAPVPPPQPIPKATLPVTAAPPSKPAAPKPAPARPAGSPAKAAPGESNGSGGNAGPSSSGVTLGSRDFPMPPYPPGAIERRYQGTVVLSIRVLDGAIQEVSVASSSGYVLLDTSAIRWIRSRWRFPPQISRTFNQKIRFELAN